MVDNLDQKDPSGFLESFPTYRLHSKPRSCSEVLWVFSSKDERYENNSYSPDDAGTWTMINDKIKSAFSKMNLGFHIIAQFWAPVTIGGKHLLSTSGQPFAVSYLHKDLIKYRRLRVEHVYDIDVNSNNSKFRGTPASAFLNRFAEIATMNTSVYQEAVPLLHYSFLIPIYRPYQTSSSSDCIGVIECSSWLIERLFLLNVMSMAIKEVGLGVYNVQDRIPYKTMKGLKLVRDEIQEALKIVCESHNIGVAQAWISYEDEYHVPFSFSSEDTQTTRRLALKLTGYNEYYEYSTASSLRFNEYYEACDMVPLQMGEGLVEKTLQDYQPRFCENISQLGYDTLIGSVSTEYRACSGFTICTSIDTGDYNCAFEFVWHHNPNYVLLLEALLLTLKRCLPHFNFASGAELGDQLHVIDVDNSTKSETKFFKIFNEKRLSSIPKEIDNGKKAMVINYNAHARSKEKRDTTEIELSREDIEQHYGKTMKKAAEELGVSLSTLKRKHNILGMSGLQGPDLLQRKAYKSNKYQSKESHTHEKDNGVIQDSSPVKRNENTDIKAEYEDDIIKIHLGNSEATFVTVENEIGKKFKLKHGTFKIKYRDEDEEWILMTSDEDLSDCIQNSRNVDRSAVRLRVLLHNQ